MEGPHWDRTRSENQAVARETFGRLRMAYTFDASRQEFDPARCDDLSIDRGDTDICWDDGNCVWRHWHRDEPTSPMQVELSRDDASPFLGFIVAGLASLPFWCGLALFIRVR